MTSTNPQPQKHPTSTLFSFFRRDGDLSWSETDSEESEEDSDSDTHLELDHTSEVYDVSLPPISPDTPPKSTTPEPPTTDTVLPKETTSAAVSPQTSQKRLRSRGKFIFQGNSYLQQVAHLLETDPGALHEGLRYSFQQRLTE